MVTWVDYTQVDFKTEYDQLVRLLSCSNRVHKDQYKVIVVINIDVLISMNKI